MTESNWLSLIAGLMVLILLVGGLARRPVALGENVRIALMWIAIIVIATLIVRFVLHLPS